MDRLKFYFRYWLEGDHRVLLVSAYVFVGVLAIKWLQDRHLAFRIPLYIIVGALVLSVAWHIVNTSIGIVISMWRRYARSPRAVASLIRAELPELDRNPQGNSAYIDDLIDKGQRALSKYDCGRPINDKWGELHYSVGVLYELRRTGDRSANVERAIHHYNRALEQYAGSPESEQWTRANSDLGYLYRNRFQGDQAENAESAIRHGRIALEARTRNVFPMSWWVDPDNPGDILNRRVPGNHADVNALVTALLRDRGENPDSIAKLDRLMEGLDGWAMSQNNLGAAFVDRVRGDQAENIELAITHCHQALEVLTPTHGRQDWATTCGTLGSAYGERIRGDRAHNLELAIFYHQEALRIYSDPIKPEDWARTHNNLAAAYLERIRGDGAENLEQSIEHLELALDVYAREMFPDRWAAIQNTLGSAYTNRIRGDREENIERAIQYLEAALEVYDRSSYPEDWARAHVNLGLAYNARIKGDPADNLDLAVEHCQLALQVFAIDSSPQEWALVQNNLGGIYLLRVRGGRERNIEQAIFHLHEAMRINTAESFPRAWANIQSNLGGAYGYLIRRSNFDSLQWAVHHGHQALKIYTFDDFPKEWARVHNNLGMDYYRAMLLGGGDYAKEIVHHFRQSLLVRTPRMYPHECRDTAYSLGQVLYDKDRFWEAREALVIAHEALEALRGEIIRDKSRRAVSDENADLYSMLVSCCLIEGDADAALQYAVAGKGRSFVDTLASARFDLSAAGADDPQLAEDIQKAQALRKQIDSILARMEYDENAQDKELPNIERSMSAQLSDKLLELRTQYAEQWDAMSYKYPALSATQVAPAVSASDACDLARRLDATLVEYFRHAQGWCALVATPASVQHVPLPMLDDRLLERMRAWVRRVADKESGAGRNELSYEALHRLHKAVIAPLDVHLAPGQAVVMAPYGDLHLVPLPAALDRVTGRYVWEDYNLSFAPSIAALSVSLHRARTQTGRTRQGPAERMLSVAYPGMPGSEHYLSGVLAEAEVIERHFNEVIALHEEIATPDAAIAQARGQDIVHFGCHGLFDSDTPTESGLMLSGGWLTVQRIVTELHLDGAHLATVAACESGQMALSRGEEHVGLLQALMTAGAQTVVASLWSVDDKATRTLFGAFYAGIRAGCAPPAALVDAANYVRQQPGWEHPYYWAAFQASGLPFDVAGSEVEGSQTKCESRAQDVFRNMHFDDPRARARNIGDS